jgi:hypothetical protein
LKERRRIPLGITKNTWRRLKIALGEPQSSIDWVGERVESKWSQGTGQEFEYFEASDLSGG